MSACRHTSSCGRTAIRMRPSSTSALRSTGHILFERSDVGSTCVVEFVCHAVQAVQGPFAHGPSQVRVTLADGRVVVGDLLIVADGANSSLRRALFPDAKLEYAGVRSYSGTLPCSSGCSDAAAAERAGACAGRSSALQLNCAPSHHYVL